MDQNQESTFVKLKQKEFKNILKQVDFSMAQQDIRYYLNGLLFEVDNQKLNISFVAKKKIGKDYYHPLSKLFLA